MRVIIVTIDADRWGQASLAASLAEPGTRRMVLNHGGEALRGLDSGNSRGAIVSLKTHYCQWLDGEQWDRWASLFTDDAVMQVGPSADAAVRGRPAIRRLLAGLLDRTFGEALQVGLARGQRP